MHRILGAHRAVESVRSSKNLRIRQRRIGEHGPTLPRERTATCFGFTRTHYSPRSRSMVAGRLL
jgi:hypothetical protein